MSLPNESSSTSSPMSISSSPDVMHVSSPSIQTPNNLMTIDGLVDIPPSSRRIILGVGKYTEVWELENPEGTSSWAVKNKVSDRGSEEFQDCIIREAQVLADIHHENIIGYRGLLKAPDGRLCLAMELGGPNLGDLIEIESEEISKKIFSPSGIMKVVLSVAKALHYLHTEKKYLHGDIKTHNILINGDFEEVKLCGFGSCTELDEDGGAEDFQYIASVIFAAPEVLGLYPAPITAKCEIFSLGLVIYAMLALPAPLLGTYYTDSTISSSSCEDMESDSSSCPDVVRVTDSMASLSMEPLVVSLPIGVGTRPALPRGLGLEYHAVVDLFLLCTEENPDCRPSAADIVRMLQPRGERFS